MSKNTGKAKAVPATPAQPLTEEEEDDYERLEHLIALQNKETKEAMQRLMQQQRDEAQSAQQTMMKQMEELITNRLTPLTSLNPTPSATPPPPGDPPREIPVPLPPAPTPRAYERTPTIPSIDKLKGRSNYKTWTINIKLHAQNLHVWSAIQGQHISEEQKDLAQSLIGLNVISAIQH
jgi:hypothetical protein